MFANLLTTTSAGINKQITKFNGLDKKTLRILYANLFVGLLTLILQLIRIQVLLY